MGAAAGAAPGARKPLPDFAASMSRAITRPCGPEPCTRLRSTFASFARRRASGEEKILFEALAPSPAQASFRPLPPPPAHFVRRPLPPGERWTELAAGSEGLPLPLGERVGVRG